MKRQKKVNILIYGPRITVNNEPVFDTCKQLLTAYRQQYRPQTPDGTAYEAILVLSKDQGGSGRRSVGIVGA